MSSKPSPVNSLAQLLEQHGFIPEPQVSWMFAYVLRDLEQHHAQGELHLDIKPSRIVRAVGGTFVLRGYGESRLGTPRYMAPERVRRAKPDVRSDLYALGAVLYEAATGRPPFDCALNYELLDAHLSKRPEPPQAVRRAVSTELQRIILTALAKDPEDRFQSAREFGEALSQLARLQVETGAAEAVSVNETERASAQAAPDTSEIPCAANADRQPAPRVSSDVIRRRPARVVWIGVGLGALVLLGVLVVVIARPHRVKTPKLAGVSREAAEEMTVRTGLGFVVAGERDDTAAAGVVVDFDRRGDTLFVWLSSGLVALPAVEGLSVSDARGELEQAGAVVSRVADAYRDGLEPGRAAGTMPAAGARVSAGSSVVLLSVVGRATCPECGTRREAGAQFCIRCGYRYKDAR